MIWNWYRLQRMRVDLKLLKLLWEVFILSCTLWNVNFFLVLHNLASHPIKITFRMQFSILSKLSFYAFYTIQMNISKCNNKTTLLNVLFFCRDNFHSLCEKLKVMHLGNCYNNFPFPFFSSKKVAPFPFFSLKIFFVTHAIWLRNKLQCLTITWHKLNLIFISFITCVIEYYHAPVSGGAQ